MEHFFSDEEDPLVLNLPVEDEQDSISLKRHCPFIGLEQDAGTVMAFPTFRNWCHRLQPPQQARLDYQRTHCLTFAHRHCPVLLEPSLESLPPEISVSLTKRRSIVMILGAASIFTLLVVAFMLFSSWESTSANDWFFGTDKTQGQEELIEAPVVLPTNLVQPTVPPNQLLYVPLIGNQIQNVENIPALASPTWTPTPQQTPTLQSCDYPAGWVVYSVRPGDTIDSISQAVGSTVEELKDGNCLETPPSIWVGLDLLVPHKISTTATPLSTARTRVTESPTPITHPTDTTDPTLTSTPLSTDKPLPGNSATPKPTSTALPAKTNTALPSSTASPTLGYIPLPTRTFAPPPTSTALPTRTPILSATSTALPTSTATPIPSDTPIPTFTFTPVPSHTPVPSSTSTPLPTNTPTDVPFSTVVP